MNALSVFQAVSLVSVSLTVIWSVVKITRAIVSFVAFCSRILSEHDEMWAYHCENHRSRTLHAEHGPNGSAVAPI